MHSALLKKLRLKETDNLLLINSFELAHYFEAIHPDVSIVPNRSYDAVLVVVESLSQLYNQTHEIIQQQLLSINGRLLIAYPKKGNKLNKPFLHRDDLFPTLNVDQDGYVQRTDYKFNQMVALDEHYTIVGLKYVTQASNKSRETRTSQCVADYAERIPDLIQLLTNETKALAFYQQLTPGYQKGWARYIFSAKQPSTQTKRLNETIDFLNRGIKAKHLA